ncbi:hypothetical protein HYT25_04345 [Candidatus Pacearchaeota archaeon]|nr:hypothetical protein [Candidatus Pacearchaeota archaeon]
MSIQIEKKNDEKITKNFLQESISSVIGKQGEEIIKFLDTEKYINEFIIAKKLDININQTRNLLYRLSEHGLVSSTRKKDKKKGWYTYFWRLEALRTLEFLKEMLKKRISQIEHQIQSREVKTFYVCERCNIEYNEENALLHDFTCSECGNVFIVKDNTKVIKEFRKNLDKSQKELEIINNEIRKEKEKDDKKKVKEIKKEVKEKLKKRLEKKKERDKLKAKEMKQAKKVPKKAIVKKPQKKKETRNVKSRKKIKVKTKKIQKKKKRR